MAAMYKHGKVHRKNIPKEVQARMVFIYFEIKDIHIIIIYMYAYLSYHF